jgi:serine O-acetyltransferase
MLENYIEDVKRYFDMAERERGITNWMLIKKIWNTNTLWIIFLYRFGRWLNYEFSMPIVKTVLKIFYHVASTIIPLMYNTHIQIKAEIGKGLYIGHYGGIWIGPVKMGMNCNLSQEVTIGIGGKGEHRGVPELGNNVYIGPGAKVFGKIIIGNNVAIGANSVVSKNISDNAVVVGNPARIVGYEGSSGLIELDEFDNLL